MLHASPPRGNTQVPPLSLRDLRSRYVFAPVRSDSLTKMGLCHIGIYHTIASLSKLLLAFQRLLFRSIFKHLPDKVPSRQFGFRSCVIQLLSFFDKIFGRSYPKKKPPAISLDFSKSLIESLNLYYKRLKSALYLRLKKRKAFFLKKNLKFSKKKILSENVAQCQKM